MCHVLEFFHAGVIYFMLEFFSVTSEGQDSLQVYGPSLGLELSLSHLQAFCVNILFGGLKRAN